MRIRRKTQSCLNCGHTLDQIYNYCPRCGQENNDRMVSFGELVKDFFINYFSFDTKFIRSTKPFLFAPGELASLFISGKRASYVNPLRLYIIVSVIFFFLSTLLVKESLQNAGVQLNLEDQQMSATATNTQVDSLQTKSLGFAWHELSAILAEETLTNQEALDSLKTYTGLEIVINGYFGQHFFTQLRKVARQDLEIFSAYVLQNMPVMMFLLLPVFALILKLLYMRRNVLYVKHLIHGIHLHAFVFFLLTLLLLVYLIFDVSQVVGSYVQLTVNILMLLYVYMSMLRVYDQHWFKTLIKFTLLSVVYFFLLIIFGLSETLISFLIF